MCGIIGILTKKNNLKELIFKSLQRLSYRGYDSAGIASFANNNLEIIKSIGGINNLENKIDSQKICFSGNIIGLAHTRWATHGEVKDENTHPLNTKVTCAVHNGVIENYHEIKKQLIVENIKFSSETDTELIPILITKFLNQGLSKTSAISSCFKILKGTFAVGILFNDEPSRIYAYKNGSPLVFSYSADEQIFCISSDIFSISLTSDYFLKINDNEIVIIDNENTFDGKNYTFIDSITLQKIEKNDKPLKIEKSELDSASKEGFENYMIKEIFEQPNVISETIGSVYEASKNEFLIKNDFLLEKNLPNIMKIIGCGSSFIAGNIGAYYLQKLALINAFTENASEFRYSEEPIGIYDVIMFISQSGETADILAAINKTKACCEKTIISLTNNKFSSVESLSDVNLMTKAGQEISVASTKTFTTQIVIFIYLAIYFGKLRNLIDEESSKNLMTRLISTSRKINELLNNSKFINKIKEISKILSGQNNVIFIGREIYYHIASEGSLKLKEISYINSQSLHTGELKHGPLALIDNKAHVIIMCPENELYEKNIVTIEEILTRHANVIIITDSEKTQEYFQNNKNVKIILINEKHDFISSPFLFIVCVQLLAYYTAIELGRDIDKPRNLAKSVTVE